MRQTAKGLQADEALVMDCLQERFGGTWSPGEDPPDAYLDLDGVRIAVEISRLVQQVAESNGGETSRLDQDIPVVKMIDRIEKRLRTGAPKGRFVVLTLKAPLDDFKKLEGQLEAYVAAVLSDPPQRQSATVAGNCILVSTHDSERPSGKCLVGFVANRHSTPDIAYNAHVTLEARVRIKARKMATVGRAGACWLALYNDYFLADGDTYRRAMSQLSVEHPFARILLVNDSRQVEDLLPLGESGP